MQELPFTKADLVSLIRGGAGVARAFLRSCFGGPVGKYCPENHYMRGPGPKWREKHVLNRPAAGSA